MDAHAPVCNKIREAPPRSRGWTASPVRLIEAHTGSPAFAGMDPTPASTASGRSRLPRVRGDGPRDRTAKLFGPLAPPRSRGWTRCAHRDVRHADGSPAFAGMDPLRPLAGQRRRWLPRVRGDGPYRRSHATCPSWAPPRSRGWTRGRRDGLRRGPGSPAFAGMDPPLARGRRSTGGLPRVRGDGPHPQPLAVRLRRAPPRSRGWTALDSPATLADAGSPAFAGMDPATRSRSRGIRRLPRVRGDGPWREVSREDADTAPPRSRGWTRGDLRPAPLARGSPAFAGMDPTRRSTARSCRGLPRVRGDGPEAVGNNKVDDTAPPRSRGWTQFAHAEERRVAGSPAFAGMDPPRGATSAARSGLPRVRGDGPSARSGCGRRTLAPPRSRGWTPADGARQRHASGSPAFAGMDPRRAAGSSSQSWLPRVRGDGPRPGTRSSPSSVAPPRSRGWTAGRRVVIGGHVGSPAFAGMDPRRGATSAARSGLPRVRGDGPTREVAQTNRERAPPRSRGWTRGQRAPRPRRGGSPAFAGMDPSGCARRSRRSRLPRVRGDGPDAAATTATASRAPPRSRGWTAAARARRAAERGSPAFAGMDPRRGRSFAT